MSKYISTKIISQMKGRGFHPDGRSSSSELFFGALLSYPLILFLYQNFWLKCDKIWLSLSLLIGPEEIGRKQKHSSDGN